jgi:DNA-binding transcriptional LysR family regulator
MDIREMRYFVSVAEHLNFTEAARQLFVSQSTVSYQIAELEQQLNLKLFIRNKHSVRLTSAGAVLYREVKDIVNRLNRAVNNARQAVDGAVGKLKIGHYGAIEEKFLGQTLKRFTRTYPNIELDITRIVYAPLVNAVENGKIDIGFTFNMGMENRTEICRYKLFSGSWAVFLSPDHPWANRTELTVADLRSEPMVHFFPENYPAGMDSLLQLCSRESFSPNFVRYTDDMEHLVFLIQVGLGVSVMPNQIHKCYPFYKLCCIDLVDANVSIDTFVIWKKRVVNPSIPIFLRRLGILIERTEAD